jgi:hypothetical protein
MRGIRLQSLLSAEFGARLFPTVGTIGSLVAVALSLRQEGEQLSQIGYIGVATFLAFGFATLVSDARMYLRATPLRLGSDKSIRDYMYNWIDKGARVAVFSHDLSWVVDDEMRAMLRRKAEGGELALVMPTATIESDALRASGAELLNYSEFGYTIKSRFTIVNLDRADARVAIGHRVSNTRHDIQEFSAGVDPAYYLALDMVELIRRMRPSAD